MPKEPPKPEKDPDEDRGSYRSVTVGRYKRGKAGKLRYRHAKTGKFVTKAYAKRHPKTTVREAARPSKRRQRK